MTTVTKENLIQILQDDPVLVEELRSLLLTQELLELPQKLAEFTEYANKQFEAVNKQLEIINGRLNILDADVNQLKIDGAYLKGKILEMELPGRALSRLEYRFDIIRPRLLRSSTHYPSAHDFTDAIRDASKGRVISEIQRRRILDTDMIVQGRGEDTGKDTFVALESSFTIADSDIVRANRTATALRKIFPDADVRAAVYCAEISDENTQRAQDDGVEVISNARL